MVSVKIDGNEIKVEDGTTIYNAAKMINVNIPTLCYMDNSNYNKVSCKGSCRICVVEIEGKSGLVASCSTEVKEGMHIKTNSYKVNTARKDIIELLLSDHPNDCLNCNKNMNCELQRLACDYGIQKSVFKKKEKKIEKDESSVIIRDMNKCILCRRCINTCSKVQDMNVLTAIGRGIETKVGTFNCNELLESECSYCGQCIAVCPTGALIERIDYLRLPKILNDKNKNVIVQIAPAVRTALCEEFNMSKEFLTTNKIVAILKKLNFYKVFDTNFSADLTIMEEANEFLNRFKKNEDLPMFTSCCPAWVRTVELKYSQKINLLSSCKSPQQMFGAVAKEYLPKKLGIDKENMVVVSIMPCIAKKYEAEIEDMKDDVDLVITTREFVKLIKQAGINVNSIEEEEFDNPLGMSTGAGMLFGASGGVMEAALRTAYELYTGEELKEIVFQDIRGMKGIKEATIDMKGRVLKVAAVSSLRNAQKIMEDMSNGNNNYDFIEVMACPSGCINGGGQPYIKSDKLAIEKRMKLIYEEESANSIRKAHDNPSIKEIYNEFLGLPNGKLAHKILHRNL